MSIHDAVDFVRSYYSGPLKTPYIEPSKNLYSNIRLLIAMNPQLKKIIHIDKHDNIMCENCEECERCIACRDCYNCYNCYELYDCSNERNITSGSD